MPAVRPIEMLRDHVPALLLLCGAAFPRALWIAAFNWVPVSDSAWYQARAIELAHGLGYAVGGVPTAFFPIGYPLFLASLFTFLPSTAITVASANLVLGVSLVWTSSALFSELGVGRSRAFVGALIVALCPTMVLYTTLEMSETLFTFLLISATTLLLVGRRRWGATVAAGLLFGAAALVRSQVLLLPALMLCLLAVSGAGLRWTMRSAFVVYATVACLVLPWTARNWHELGSPILVSTNDGYNLLVGNNPWQRWGSGYPPPPELAEMLRPTPDEQGTGPGEARWDHRLRAQALTYLGQDPLHYLALVPRKIFRHFSVDNEVVIQNDMGARAAGDEIGFWRTIGPINAAFHGLMLCGFLLALCLSIFRRKILWKVWFCALPALYFAAISGVFFAEQRFNFPAIPFMIGAAVIGLTSLVEWVKGRHVPLHAPPIPDAEALSHRVP